MSERQPFLQAQVKNREVTRAQPELPVVTDNDRGRLARVIHGRIWLLLGLVLLATITLLVLSNESLAGPGKAPTRQLFPTPALANGALFREYSLPLKGNEVMRPAIDRQGRIWFGAMGQNALVVFDPHTRTFEYLTPPRGHHGIMGVQVAPDNTIWFAEQYANYIGHYFPATGRYQLYPLPWITVPDPGQTGQKLSLPSAPNELALDAHGDVWFTESGNNQLGRFDPKTGALHVVAVPDSHALTMEIASDEQGSLWVTSFTPGLLFRYEPGTGTFTTYTVSLRGKDRGTLYGLLVPTSVDVWVTILAEDMLHTSMYALAASCTIAFLLLVVYH